MAQNGEKRGGDIETPQPPIFAQKCCVSIFSIKILK
jgi:hypothetical protein